MNLLRPFAIATVAMVCLSGCILSPGQHMARTAPGPAKIHTSSSDQLDLVAITPRLIAMDRAARDGGDVPDALARYRPGPYRIDAGDVLYITVWDHPELTVPAGAQQALNAAGRLVQSDGTLFYPYIGKVRAVGMTPTELRDDLAEKLARYVESPQVDVSVLSYASQRVWVTGATARPAVVALTVVPLTLNDAVGNAGFNPAEADLSGVRLTRDGVTYVLDMTHLGGDPIYLKGNDHIYVPFLDAKEVFVVGEVNLPGAQNFKTGSISLSQALGRSRGLAQSTSNGNAIYVIRGSHDLEQNPSVVYQLEAKSPAAFAVASQFELLPGDVVFVGAAGITRWSRFVSQLLPFSGILSNAANVSSDL